MHRVVFKRLSPTLFWSAVLTCACTGAAPRLAYADAPNGEPAALKARDDPELEPPDHACHVRLREAGVSFAKLAKARAPRVQLPIRLTGAVAGIEIRGAGKEATGYLDCRLALALVRWAPALKAAGIVRVDHYSIYRPDARVADTRKISSHAAGLAIDAARFHTSDGRVLTILETWTDKTPDADPCAARQRQSPAERLLRELVCDALRSDIFQTVVTPHHDAAHANHVHLEVQNSDEPAWMH
jgi:hypothetical protein